MVWFMDSWTVRWDANSTASRWWPLPGKSPCLVQSSSACAKLRAYQEVKQGRYMHLRMYLCISFHECMYACNLHVCMHRVPGNCWSLAGCKKVPSWWPQVLFGAYEVGSPWLMMVENGFYLVRNTEKCWLCKLSMVSLWTTVLSIHWYAWALSASCWCAGR